MAKPVLLITRRVPPAVEARAVRDYDAWLNPQDTPRTGADIVRLAEGADAVMCCPAEKLDAALIRALPASVKVLATYSVGYDHIDLGALRARNVRLLNTPDVLSVATAECAMLLILAAARRAGEGERLVRSGRWTGWAPTQLLGPSLSPTRHLRHGPNRPRAGAHGWRVRHGGALPQSAPPARRAGARSDLS
jgi:lactate dehydrogenase-like 2-hydroxyacid dehydrogenase